MNESGLKVFIFIRVCISKQVAFIKRVSIAHRCTIEKVHNTKYIKYMKKYILMVIRKKT